MKHPDWQVSLTRDWSSAWTAPLPPDCSLVDSVTQCSYPGYVLTRHPSTLYTVYGPLIWIQIQITKLVCPINNRGWFYLSFHISFYLPIWFGWLILKQSFISFIIYTHKLVGGALNIILNEGSRCLFVRELVFMYIFCRFCLRRS